MPPLGDIKRYLVVWECGKTRPRLLLLRVTNHTLFQIICLLYGGDFYLFDPGNEGIKHDHEEYELHALRRMYRFFGPYPPSFHEIADDNARNATGILHEVEPLAGRFSNIAAHEVPEADSKFILKMMKLDSRDRPTAEELLDDEWFAEESEDTRRVPDWVKR